jgi:4,5-dihydroxyphthalate decarboxylase
MSSLPLTLATADYSRLMPFFTGEVSPKGIDLKLMLGSSGSWPKRAELLRMVLSDPTIDGGESSIGGHVRRIAEGDRSFVALPIFVLRGFAARDLYVRKDGPVRRPSDLFGKRLGLYSWVASGSVWYRHFQRYIGVPLDAVEWWVGDIEVAGETSHMVTLPASVNPAPPGRFLAEMLVAGELDAMWSPPRPKFYHPKQGPIVRLLPDMRATEAAYFRETGVYPPLHLVVLRRPVWEANRWVAHALTEAFDRCNASFAASQRGFPYAVPWLEAELDETAALMGENFYSNGLEQNRAQLELFNELAFTAGIIGRRVGVDECFAEFLEQ